MNLPAGALVEIKDLQAGYGELQVLHGVTMSVEFGQAVCLLGRNGAGRSTIVKAMMGILRPRGGQIRISGRPTAASPIHSIAKLGVGWVPEGRRIIPTLTVRENLVAFSSRGSWTADRVYELFPNLKRRADTLGGALSGGEQQMLAIGRALATNPSILILDEATEGLAPLVRETIWEAVAYLKTQGLAMLIVDKELDQMLVVGDRHYIIEKGSVVWSGNSDAFRADRAALEMFLGV